MNHQPIKNSNLTPNIKIEHLREELAYNDLQDLCDATDSAIENGGGFGWINLPARETLERYWQGVIVMPQRHLFVARHDDIICGTCQLIKQPMNNEAQSHIMQLNTHFVAPWARGYGLARMLLQRAEKQALKEGASVINLDVRETQDMAIALYESEGYDQCGTHPAYAYVDGSFIQGRYYMKLLENDRQ
jgi:ribosomal protein S18 acetylase RimI-like enzyme